MAARRPSLTGVMMAGGSAAACLLAAAGTSAAPPAASGMAPGNGGYRQQPVREQDVAQERVRRGELWRLEDLLPRARRVGGGEYLGVEPQGMGDRYRFKFRRSGGEVVWVDMDGRTGAVLAVRD
jgi:hypothetical protein